MTPLRVFRKTTPLVNAIRLSLLPLAGLGQRWLQRYRDLSGREQMALMRLGNIGVMAELIAHGMPADLPVMALEALIDGEWQPFPGDFA